MPQHVYGTVAMVTCFLGYGPLKDSKPGYYALRAFFMSKDPYFVVGAPLLTFHCCPVEPGDYGMVVMVTDFL